MMVRRVLSIVALALVLIGAPVARAADDAARLVAAMLSDTPLIDDLRALTDRFGGRTTGTVANERSVAWAVERFKAAGVEARAEVFEMPGLWLENSASAVVEGEGFRFPLRVAASFDTGSGRIRGFSTSGRLGEIGEVLDAALAPVAGLGPFVHDDGAYFGTDHLDFVLEGVPGLFADQESANFGPNYHARSDTFERVDQEQLKLNAAIAAAFVWGFANAEVDWERQDRAAVQRIIDAGLGEQMRAFRVMKQWEQRKRGRPE